MAIESYDPNKQQPPAPPPVDPRAIGREIVNAMMESVPPVQQEDEVQALRRQYQKEGWKDDAAQAMAQAAEVAAQKALRIAQQNYNADMAQRSAQQTQQVALSAADKVLKSTLKRAVKENPALGDEVIRSGVQSRAASIYMADEARANAWRGGRLDEEAYEEAIEKALDEAENLLDKGKKGGNLAAKPTSGNKGKAEEGEGEDMDDPDYWEDKIESLEEHQRKYYMGTVGFYVRRAGMTEEAARKRAFEEARNTPKPPTKLRDRG